MSRLSSNAVDAVIKRPLRKRLTRLHTANIEEIGGQEPDAYIAEAELQALNEEGTFILTKISQELERRFTRNDSLTILPVQTTDSELEGFKLNGDVAIFSDHESVTPPINLIDYLNRLARYVNIWHNESGGEETAGIRAAIMSLIYIDKIESDGVQLSRDTIHRLVMVGFLVATKYIGGQPLSNSFWAKVGGVPTEEVNALECVFCKLIRFKHFVSEEEYYQYLDELNMPEF